MRRLGACRVRNKRGMVVRLFAQSLTLLACALFAGQTIAQSYPVKPIRLLVPFPPGGSTDLVARSYVAKLGVLLGQQVIVEYRAGAGGSIGAAEVARAVPDGYTLLQVWDTHGANHHVYKVQYDFLKSFDPISLLVQAPGILVAHPGFPPSTVRDLVQYAKANPEKVTVGTAGFGSSGHLAGLLFSEMAGIRMTVVNYKGGGPLTTDIMGGHVNLVFGSFPLWEQHVKSGKLKALAVLSPRRTPRFPELAAASETIPGFELKTWFGLLAPAGTPTEIIARLNRDVARALADVQVKEQLTSRGFHVAATSPEEFALFLREQSEVSGRLIREAGIKPE
jgi:tripartite-type tricarboxylate transporter receptor subunit TctC